MAFDIYPTNTLKHTRRWAKVHHGHNDFFAWVLLDEEHYLAKPLKSVNAELAYESLLSIRVTVPFSDEDSGIRQDENDESKCVISGRITNIFFDISSVYVDIYLANGPEFLLLEFKNSQLPTLQLDCGVEVIVEGLTIMCTNAGGPHD